ncbi:MAG: hypothetical protein HOV68_30100, partial [Streptomycetaceae bacterium]|nr:hypothetical protein [Streptomycetaceae bacterium]
MHQEGDGPGSTTDFTGYSHEQMLQMFNGATPNLAFEAFMRLGAAGQALTEAAKVLSTEIGNLDWEGPAAERFRAWADQLVVATHNLSDYAGNVGGRMGDVAMSIGSVKLPPVPTADVDLVNSVTANPAAVSFAAATNPAEAAKLTADVEKAKTNIEAQRQEAAAQMRKLAMGYESAAHQLTTMVPPTFPPPLNLWGVESSEPFEDTDRPVDTYRRDTDGPTVRTGHGAVVPGVDGAGGAPPGSQPAAPVPSAAPNT